MEIETDWKQRLQQGLTLAAAELQQKNEIASHRASILWTSWYEMLNVASQHATILLRDYNYSLRTNRSDSSGSTSWIELALVQPDSFGTWKPVSHVRIKPAQNTGNVTYSCNPNSLSAGLPDLDLDMAGQGDIEELVTAFVVAAFRSRIGL